MAALTLIHDSDNLLVLKNLKDELEELKGNAAFVNGATVQATVYESDQSTEVSGVNWPVALTYLTGSDGTYYVTLDEGMTVEPYDDLWLEVEVNPSSDPSRIFSERVSVEDIT